MALAHLSINDNSSELFRNQSEFSSPFHAISIGIGIICMLEFY